MATLSARVTHERIKTCNLDVAGLVATRAHHLRTLRLDVPGLVAELTLLELVFPSTFGCDVPSLIAEVAGFGFVRRAKPTEYG